MLEVPPTPPSTLRRARRIAKTAGLLHVYTGNVHDLEGDTTFCDGCGAKVIERDWYEVLAYRLDAGGRCSSCGHAVAGVYGAGPEQFGRRRLRVAIA
jgi:pyruvate formate lyase activating enzyme